MLIAIVVTIAIIKKCYILLPEQKSIVPVLPRLIKCIVNTLL